jgi:hypothetical protein
MVCELLTGEHVLQTVQDLNFRVAGRTLKRFFDLDIELVLSDKLHGQC